MEKQERKERKILTENRLVTVNKRETSFEGLVSQFENGEDGIYSLMTNNKNMIFQPKVMITKKDLEEIPDLREIRKAIDYWEAMQKVASGKDVYVIKKTIIELRKMQYIVKDSYRVPIVLKNITHSKRAFPPLDEEVTVDKNYNCHATGISLINPAVCSAVLCNYFQLKQTSEGNFEADTWYFMQDFDRICRKGLEEFPIYKKIVEEKIYGAQNIEIQQTLQEEFGIKYSIEYISNLWRNKIPNLIAAAAEEEYLNWYFLTQEKGKYKKCSRCGQIKLASPKNFTKNNSSKDGLYSICKKCRNAKNKNK